MVDGKQGASVYNQSISGAANVIDTVASQFGFLGKMFGSAVTAGAKYVVAVNEQSDKLFETYQDMSRTGLSTGMDDIFTNLHSMGYTIKDIGKMGALMKENATVLANFGGTAAGGAKQLGLISKEMQYSDVVTGLKRMGMTTDDINQGTVAYMRQLQTSGALQKQTNAQLAEGAKEFIEEQDRLTKLTGINAKTQNEIYERQLADQRFSATQADLNAKGDEASLAKAKRNKELLIGFSGQFGDQTSKAFADYASGTMTSEEAQKFQRNFPKAAEAIDKGIASSEEILDLAHSDAAVTVDKITELAKQGLAEKENIKIAELIKGSQYKDSAAAKKALESAKKEQKDQKSGVDKQVADQVDLRQSQLNQTQAFEQLINDGIGPVTGAVKGFAKAIDTVAGGAGSLAGREGTVGKGPAPSAPGKGMSQEDLIKSGLKLKSGDVQGAGNSLNSAIIEMAKKVQGGGVANFNYFSGFNDKWHNENATNSQHAKGNAMDFTLTKPPSKEEGQKIVSYLKGLGASLAIDEYNNPSSKATAGHIHAQVPQAATGGILTGPTSGYQAMLHGTEAVVPMGGKKAVTVETKGNPEEDKLLEIISKKILTLDAVINGMTRSNSNSAKILQRTA